MGTDSVMAGHGSHGRFVGRRQELTVLSEQLERARQGQGSVTLVAGEPGIGKTSIMQQFAANARLADTEVLWGRCYEGDWTPPYAAWVEALAGYAGRTDADLLQRQLGDDAAVVAQLVPALRNALPAGTLSLNLTADEERFRLFDAISRFLVTVAERRPLLLVLDDLHWADRASLALLQYAARSVHDTHLLLLGAYRDDEVIPGHPLHELLPALLHDPGYRRIALRGLSEREVSTYLTQRSQQELPAMLVREIQAETRGNPFFAGEMLLHALEQGQASEASAVRPGAPRVPASVRQVVGRRLARLSANTNRLLSFAAAFTGGFEIRVLQTVSGLEDDAVLDCVDAALWAQLIQPLDGEADSYDFVHAIVRHTLYEALSPSRRLRLHRQIAEALERVYGEQRREHAAEIAVQFHASIGLAGAAGGVPHALDAAEQAHAGASIEQAVTFLRMARDLATFSDAGTRAQVLCQLAIAEAEALMLSDAQDTVQMALTALQESSASPRQVAEFLTVVVGAFKDSGAIETVWRPLVQRGLTLAGEERDLLWARLMLLDDPIETVARGTIHAGRWTGFDPQAVEIARSDGGDDDYARTLWYFDWRSLDETESYVRLSSRWSRPAARLRAMRMATVELIYCHGAFYRAVELAQELLELAQRYGALPAQAEALLWLTLANTALGNFPPARETLARALAIVHRIGRGHLHVHNVAGATRVAFGYYLGGDWPDIAEAWTAMLRTPPTAGGPLGLAGVARTIVALTQAGEEVEAHRLIAAVTPVLEQMPPRMYGQTIATTVTATAVWDLSLSEYAASYRRLAYDLIAAGAGDYATTSNELTVARMAVLLGRTAEAHEYFVRARTALEASGQRPLRAIVDFDEAKALLRGSSADAMRIDALLDTAINGFRSLGMDLWTRRASQVQQSLSASSVGQRSDARRYPDGLTPREVEVLRLIAGGRTNKQIADELVVSPNTLERHITNAYGKIGARGKADATAYVLRHDLI